MPRARRIVRRVLYPIVGLLFLLIAVIRISCPTAIRIDSGDVRYTALLIPVWIDRTPEPQRSVLLSLAHDAGISSEWAAIPLQTSSNDNAAMCHDYYEEVAVWATADRKLGQCMLQDVSECIRAGAGIKYRLSSAGTLLLSVEPDRVVPTDWTENPYLREDPGIQTLFLKHGYTLPLSKTATSASHKAGTTRP
jgi:hypothetical protein